MELNGKSPAFWWEFSPGEDEEDEETSPKSILPSAALTLLAPPRRSEVSRERQVRVPQKILKNLWFTADRE
ncbi:hypothetical protein EH105704_04_00590 [Atlantibacter hermannii NBRC 105704]|uniref:Uncharacterized protein n=1 Tax=Atlantibacter hermannii NBRC 105704 TaxID=1115512 RepID=H5V1G0_ATLHE|nr:hypothetical protein EH105704_04_00590 [Atlantibacter hermannii NBRC 105704]